MSVEAPEQVSDPHESRSLDAIAPESEPSVRDAFDQATEGQDLDTITVSDDDGSGEVAGVETPTEQPVRTWRDEFVDNGFNLPDDADPATGAKLIAQHTQQLHQQAQQANYYRQQAAALQQQMAAYQQAQQQAQQVPQAPAQPAQPEKPKKPEWNPEWAKLVKRDEATGQLIPANPDIASWISPDIPQKVEAYLKYQKAQQEKWLDLDPEEVEQRAIDKALEKFRAEQQEQYQKQQQAAYEQQSRQATYQTLEQNKDWLYEPGQVLPNGQRPLSPLGRRYYEHVVRATQIGITDIGEQDFYAQARLRTELAAESGQQAAPQQAQAAPTPQQAYLNKAKAATGGRPRGTQVANSLANSNPPSQNPSLDIKQMLTRAFEDHGVR
jgi:hypothetical protein